MKKTNSGVSSTSTGERSEEFHSFSEINTRIDRLEKTLNLIVNNIENLSVKMEGQIKGDIGSGIKDLISKNKYERESTIRPEMYSPGSSA